MLLYLQNKMKKCLFFLLILSNCAFAQKGYKRSDGDLLTGTWKCVKCKDTTTQTISFYDTIYTVTKITTEGLKTDSCAFKVKKNKIFVRCEDDEKWKYKVALIDHSLLELRNRKRGNEEFKKTK
jgi:hypothetical protein